MLFVFLIVVFERRSIMSLLLVPNECGRESKPSELGEEPAVETAREIEQITELGLRRSRRIWENEAATRKREEPGRLDCPD